MEHLRTKFDIAGAATEGMFSRRWVYKNIFKIDDDEIVRIMREQYTDSKHLALTEAAGTASAESASGGGGGLDDSLDSDLDLGDEGGDLDVGETGEDIPDDGSLLAEPEAAAQRDDWYKPVASDMRSAGARKRSYLASAGESIASNTPRNLYKGWSGELSPLSRGIVGENTSKDEILITETKVEIKNLITALQKRKDENEA